MSTFQELASGNFNVYGRWAALISGILLIALGISDFIPIFPFALAGFVIAAIIVILEIPFVTKCCPTGPRAQKFAEFFSNPIFKTALYACCSAVMWLSMLMASTSILAAAIGLSVTTFSYGIAIVKKDSPATPLKEPNVAQMAAKAAISSPTKPMKTSAV